MLHQQTFDTKKLNVQGHSTLTKESVTVARELAKLPCVKQINPGFLKNVGGSRRALKIISNPVGLIVRVRGSGFVQQLIVLVETDSHDCVVELIKSIRGFEFDGVSDQTRE